MLAGSGGSGEGGYKRLQNLDAKNRLLTFAAYDAINARCAGSFDR